MFKASLERMTEVADQLHKNSRQLNECMEEMLQVKAALNEFSYMEEAIWQLNREKRKVDEEASRLSQLNRALESIQEQYRIADRRAEDYCEERSRPRAREAAAYQSLDWMTEFINRL